MLKGKFIRVSNGNAVRAVHFKGEEELITRFDLAEIETKGPIKAWWSDRTGTEVYVGDWIVMDPDTGIEFYSNFSFKKRFEPVTGGAGSGRS